VAKTGPTKAKNLLWGDITPQGTVADCVAVCKITLTSGRVLYLDHNDVIEVTGNDPSIPQPQGEEVEDEQEAQHEAPTEPVGVRPEGEAGRDEPAARPDPVGRAQGLGQAMKGLIPGR
jgi:hypothetical protein